MPGLRMASSVCGPAAHCVPAALDANIACVIEPVRSLGLPLEWLQTALGSPAQGNFRSALAALDRSPIESERSCWVSSRAPNVTLSSFRRNKSRSRSPSRCPAGKLPLTVDRLDHGPAANKTDADEQTVFPALTGSIDLMLTQKTMQYHAGLPYP